MKMLPAFLLLLCSIANAQETVHVHTDKQIYFPGETIFFKAYLLLNGLPSPTTNIYAGLYDESGRLLEGKKYPVIDGISNGDFRVNDSLATDALQLAVFTRSNIHDSSRNFHVLRLFNGRNKKISTQQHPEVFAFPGGGTLVAGLVNNIILRCTDAESNITGALYEVGSNLFIDSFRLDNGITAIQFIPEPGRRYYLLWMGYGERTHEVMLPAPAVNGAVLSADVSGNFLHYNIQKNNSIERFNKLHLSIYSGGELHYKGSVAMRNSMNYTGSISIDSFPLGTIDIHLTDNDNNLLQKKKVLINRHDVAINVIEKNLDAKGRNIIEISVGDSSLYNFSLSVIDAEIDNGTSVSIFEMILPAGAGKNVFRHLEPKQVNLLLNASVQTNTSFKYQPDNYLTLQISMKDKAHTLLDTSSLDLVINDKGFGKQFFNLPTAGHRGFAAHGLIFYDSAKVYYKIDNHKRLSQWMNAFVINDLQVPRSVVGLKLSSEKDGHNRLVRDSALNAYVLSRKGFEEAKLMQNLVIKGKRANPVTKRLQEIDEKYATGMFSGLSRGYQLNALDDPAAEQSIDIFSYITYRIPGLQTAGSLGSRYIRNTSFRHGEPVLFINETESPREALESVTPSQLAYVKFIPGIVIGSSGSTADGALYVYTKRGDEPGERLPNMKEEFVKGYNLSTEFRSPDYASSNNTAQPDHRTTLYWNPYLFTQGNDRKIRIIYYNNDVARKHLLTLKGISENGSLVEIKKVIE